MDTFIYKSTGEPLGFIRENNLYDIHGKYLGWREGDFIWNSQGQFSGRMYVLNGFNYIIKFLLDLSPLPQPPKLGNNIAVSDIPSINAAITPISLPPAYNDGF